jgi:hypothetical protein
MAALVPLLPCVEVERGEEFGVGYLRLLAHPAAAVRSQVRVPLLGELAARLQLWLVALQLTVTHQNRAPRP